MRLLRLMDEESAAPDRNLARLAARQHGVVTARQLAVMEIRKDAVYKRLRAGRLHRIHRGVYAVGHPALSQEGCWMAAVLACGREAVLSHRSAAALWRLLPITDGAVDVTTPPGGSRRERAGLRRHRTRSLPTSDVTRRREIPVTTPARTIADLRNVLPASRLRRAIREAEALGFDLGHDVEAARTRSELEHRFLRLCHRHRLPIPETNTPIGGFVVDFLWRGPALIAETDGYQYHRGRQAFEDDRARDVELRLLGYEVVRFTYRQVLDDPARVVAVLRAFIALD